MAKETKTVQSIARMYNTLHLNQDDVFHKAKLILAIYRDVVWSTLQKTGELFITASALYGRDLNAAFTYLADFAPTERRKDFEAKVTGMFETRWLIELIDNAMLKIHDYHSGGKQYFEILSKCYLAAERYTEQEILDIICMERSVFYRKKKEAVMLFGVALWGYSIPHFRGVFKPVSDANNDIPEHFAARSD